jgi:hypothetical protein
MSGLGRGRWKRGRTIEAPAVPGPVAEKRHHDGLVGNHLDGHRYRTSAPLHHRDLSRVAAGCRGAEQRLG